MCCSECCNDTSITGPDGRCLECLQDEWARRHRVNYLLMFVAWLLAWALSFCLVLFLFIV